VIPPGQVVNLRNGMTEYYYETDRAVSEYLLFHYGSQEQVLPYAYGPVEALDFPVRCVTECLDGTAVPAEARALDLGCAVGRATFELARHCSEVIGIDYSGRFVEVANRLREQGSIALAVVEQGELSNPSTVSVGAGIDRSRVTFEQGDAQALRADLGSFDVVLMANLIDRLWDPRKCLEQLPALLRPGGQLIITSPYTWLTEYTPRENWLGGYVEGDQRVGTLDTLKQLLRCDFDFAFARDLPFLIREHARKFQWSVAEASVWYRR